MTVRKARVSNKQRVDITDANGNEIHTLSWKSPTVHFKIVLSNPNDNVVGKIMDRKGRLIKDLDISLNGDDRDAVWDGKNNNGNDVNGGFYIYQIKIDGKVYQGSIIVAR